MMRGSVQRLALGNIFYQSQVRAVEEGIPLLRVANTGISAAFDGFGRQLGNIPLGERAYLDIKIPSVLTAPVFARFGNAGFFPLFGFVRRSVGCISARKTKGVRSIRTKQVHACALVNKERIQR